MEFTTSASGAPISADRSFGFSSTVLLTAFAMAYDQTANTHGPAPIMLPVNVEAKYLPNIKRYQVSTVLSSKP